jgi:hypothetical protein
MTKRNKQVRSALQLPMAFTTKRVLDPKERAAAVMLLSRLLLHVARGVDRREVVDDAS